MVACRPLGDSQVSRTSNTPKLRYLQIRIFCNATLGLMLLNKLLTDHCKSKSDLLIEISQSFQWNCDLKEYFLQSDLSFVGLISDLRRL